MPVDPTQPRKILVVHGVQTKTNVDVNPHKKIDGLVRDRLAGVPVDFTTEIYKYEDINDAAQSKLQAVIAAFLTPLEKQVPFGSLLGKIVRNGVDLVGDVLIARRDGTTARVIRQGLIDKIVSIYNAGHPLYIVAHSLGTIYAFDAINELIRTRDFFDRSSRRTWPVQGLVTMGSPLGLSMFKRNRVSSLGAGQKFFRWVNYWDRTDPVVSGSFYGKPHVGYRIVERFGSDDGVGRPVDQGWFIQDRVVDTGKVWLMAHTAYWTHPGVGDDLATLITS